MWYIRNVTHCEDLPVVRRPWAMCVCTRVRVCEAREWTSCAYTTRMQVLTLSLSRWGDGLMSVSVSVRLLKIFFIYCVSLACFFTSIIPPGERAAEIKTLFVRCRSARKGYHLWGMFFRMLRYNVAIRWALCSHDNDNLYAHLLKETVKSIMKLHSICKLRFCHKKAK